MQEIFSLLEERLRSNDTIRFDVLDPDRCIGFYAGEKMEVAGEVYCCRSLRTWMELAQLLGCIMKVPQKGERGLVRLTFEKITDHSFHTDHITQKEEKYGSSSHFARIHKMEEAAFLYYYRQALQNVTLEKRRRILDLGVNRGDEFEVIRNMVSPQHYEKMELVGIDHSQSAIETAKARFPESNVIFRAHDINALEALELGRFDLLISIGTLQSPGIRFKPFFMDLVQNSLQEDAALILGFPNSRWIGGEMVYGAKAPNYAMSEMSLLFNDVIFAKKYLQQKKYRVTITGKEYIFLTATRIGSVLR
jgi:hypothetical protein